MGGRGYSRGGRGRGGGHNQQNVGGRGSAAGANFNPFGTTQTSSYQSSGNKQSHSGASSRDRKQDVPFQGRGSGRGQHHNQQSHHSRQVASSSSSVPSNIFGYSNESLDSMVNTAPRQHQHQGFNGNKPALGHKPQHSFQKQSHFHTSTFHNNINEMDMEDNFNPSSSIFSNSVPASTNMFGQVNAAPSGNGIFGGRVTASSPFHQQNQPKQTPPVGSIFGTPLASQGGSSGLSKTAAPVASGLFGQVPKTQHGSSTIADFKQKQQQQLAQFSQVNAAPQVAPSVTSVAHAPPSASNSSDSTCSTDVKPVYSQNHFLEYGVPTLPPTAASVF